MPRSITVSESIWVARPPEAVWDYTQNYANRPTWDASVHKAEVLSTEPAPRVRVEMSSGMRCVFQYRLYERPRRTSLAMVDVESPWFSGGGSWAYEAKDSGALWTQTNTLVLRDGFLPGLLRPFAAWQLRRSTRQSMQKAKGLMESNW